MATYVNDLRLKEIATGDEAGTWGTSTNTNLELIAEAFSFGTEAITTNANTHTTTIADGSTDPGRSIFLKYTGALDSDCTITIGPNTISKLWLIENATTDSGSSGPYNIIIKQGTGATVTIPNSHTKAIYSDGAGSGGAMVEAFTDLNLTDTVTISGSTPTLTIGDAGAEDTKIVFDGNAQDFYIGLDDSADDLVIGKGSAVGTTPAIEIDENLDIKFAESIGVGQAASSTTGDIVAQTMSLLGTTPTLTLGDGGEEDVAIKFNGVKDFYIANDDSADKLVIGEGSTVGTNNILTITDDTVTLGDGAAADTALVFDGNAQDFYIALDDSADDLLVGTGSTVGSNAIITVENGGNVGIGTQTPETLTEISGAADNGLLQALQITNTDHASGETGQEVAINFKLSRAGTMRDAARLTAGKDNDWDDATNTDSNLQFDTTLNDTRNEQMRLTSVGNLHLSGGSDRRIQLGNGGAGANTVGNNTVHIRGDGVDMKLMAASGGSYLFEENGTEVMRIATGGDVRIGTSSQGAATVLTVSGTSSGGNGAAAITGTADNGPALNLRKTSTTTSSDARFIQFAANSGSTAMGGIGGNGASNAQFITLSDEREKENITPVVSVLDKVMNLNVVSFDWIKHDEHIKAGFIAQNVEKYFPEYVVENVSNEGEEERKGTTGGMSAGYIAVLTKAIQEQQEQILSLQQKIEVLENGN